MQLISCHQGRLLKLEEARLHGSSGRSFQSGLPALDETAPAGAFACGAVHELLSHNVKSKPLFVAALLARSVRNGAIIWSDPQREIFPPALAANGIDLERLYLLRPKLSDQTWAVAECLRCKGVGAVVAWLPSLSRIEARRLQLAAEQGGGVGIFLRPPGRDAQIYAAATRWLVRPAPGERTIQRWNIQLLHGHGGRLGNTVTLEYRRENHLVRAIQTVAHRSGQKTKTPWAIAS